MSSKSWVDKQMEDPDVAAGVAREMELDELRDKNATLEAKVKALKQAERDLKDTSANIVFDLNAEKMDNSDYRLENTDLRAQLAAWEALGTFEQVRQGKEAGHIERDKLRAQLAEREDALRGLSWMLERGALIRDTSKDAEHSYTLRSMKFARWLVSAFSWMYKDEG